MNKLRVELAERSYDILLGSGLLAEPGQWLSGLASSARPAVVVTDKNVWRHYGQHFVARLGASGFKAEVLALEPGEESKSLEGLSRIYNFFADNGLKRSDLVMALGGGVIGDLTGFAAATWMRGIGYIQIPTTLLSQVDSSVGGKTALNLPSAKNIIGAFHQPKLVVIDPDTLRTLPFREIGCGLGEVIKYGAISSPQLFKKLEQGRPAEGDYEAIIKECCAIKAGIVARDELDTGERALLNFGHSFGHALESRYQYHRFNHGEAVALGLVIASAIGEQMGLTEPGVTARIRQALRANKLAADLPGPLRELMPYLAADKKSESNSLKMVLLKTIGQAFIEPISFKDLEALLKPVEDQWITHC